MTNSTPKRRPIKVPKPRADFPLFCHATGRWCKKVRGKLVYFGKAADDPKGEVALQLWLDQRDDLLAGRTPRAKRGGLTVADLANAFLSHKQRQLNAGELTPRTFQDYLHCAEMVVRQFGKNRLAEDLDSADFAALRENMSKRYGPTRLAVQIQKVRTIFKFAYDEALLDKPPRYGQSFRVPSRRTIRVARNGNGSRMFSPDEIRRLINAAGVQLKAMILLAVNAGLGNSDCGNLPLSALDLEAGWLNFPRPKTGIDRRCPLWHKTVKALRVAIASRPRPASKADAGLVFLTHRGRPWVKPNGADSVGGEFGRLVRKLGLTVRGRNFYGLRHSHRTAADGCRDNRAADVIMGHSTGDMAAAYVEKIDDSRLVAVTDHVHRWLFGDNQ